MERQFFQNGVRSPRRAILVGAVVVWVLFGAYRGSALGIPETATVPAPSYSLLAPPQVLHFGMSGSPDTLDPQATTGTLTFQVTRSLYDTLVEPDREGRIVPALARAFEISESGLEWTFHLRHDVRFHHGRVLTAEDVQSTLRRAMDPLRASPNALEYWAIEAIETPTDDTVVIRLREPYAPLLAALASGWSAILPHDLIAKGHDFATEPVGTGPFRFVRWVTGTEIELARFDHYWVQGKPLLDGVRFFSLVEPAAHVEDLKIGRLHVMDIVVEPELTQLAEWPDTKIYESVSAMVVVLAFNTRRRPLNELGVRRAINAAIDKQRVLDEAYGGGRVVGTFMDVLNPFYVDFSGLYVHDPDYARRVAAVTDWPDELVISVPREFGPHRTAARLYLEMLRAVGIPVRLQLLDWSTWLTEVYRDANFDLAVIGHTGKLDPHGRLNQFGTAGTYVGWVHAEAAGLIERAARVHDTATREALYRRALEFMAIELPFVYLGSPYRRIGLFGGVEGFFMDAQLDTADLRDVVITR